MHATKGSRFQHKQDRPVNSPAVCRASRFRHSFRFARRSRAPSRFNARWPYSTTQDILYILTRIARRLSARHSHGSDDSERRTTAVRMHRFVVRLVRFQWCRYTDGAGKLSRFNACICGLGDGYRQYRIFDERFHFTVGSGVFHQRIGKS